MPRRAAALMVIGSDVNWSCIIQIPLATKNGDVIQINEVGACRSKPRPIRYNVVAIKVHQIATLVKSEPDAEP